MCAVGVLTEDIAFAFARNEHQLSQLEIDHKIAEAMPAYDLSNFEVGDLATVKDQSLGDFVSLPSDGQRVLRIRGAGITYKDPPQRASDPVFHWGKLSVHWTNPDRRNFPDPRELMSEFKTGAIQEYKGPGLLPEPLQTLTYTRYAAFTVNATFQGESTGPYKAIFIFGTYGHGKEYILPFDLLSGDHDNVGLANLLADPDYPEGFLRTRLRENPVIANWVRANEMPASSCGSVADQICCSHGRCGISQADLNRELAVPLPAPEASGSGTAFDAGSETPPPACQVTSRVGDVNAILIDTDGSGFHLTPAADGLHWDFYANHHPIHLAWTAPRSTTGWLVMPDKNERITSARQMFSNLAPQGEIRDGELNGFSALVTYDTNGDGVIDAKDNPWWAKLRIWIDSNHDGVSQLAELHTLDEVGITSTSLNCTESLLIDAFGNEFRLKGRITLKDGSKRTIYDVNLATIPVPWSQAQTK
jgi:hypothetical protein